MKMFNVLSLPEMKGEGEPSNTEVMALVGANVYPIAKSPSDSGISLERELSQ